MSLSDTQKTIKIKKFEDSKIFEVRLYNKAWWLQRINIKKPVTFFQVYNIVLR